MKNNKQAIDEFWSWFSDMSIRLASNTADQSLIRELDTWIRGLHPKLSWELGPGISKSWQLVISPNLDANLRAEAALIVSRAPSLSEWEFHALRQPKDWNYTFELQREVGGVTPVDASKWRFVLLQYPSGSHEILLVGDDLSGFTDDERWHAAAITLESILGEEILLDRIAHFELGDQIDKKFAGTERPIRMLRDAVMGN